MFENVSPSLLSPTRRKTSPRETFWKPFKCFPVGLIGLGAPAYAQEDLPACHGLIMLPGNIVQISPTGNIRKALKCFPVGLVGLGNGECFPVGLIRPTGKHFPPSL